MTEDTDLFREIAVPEEDYPFLVLMIDKDGKIGGQWVIAGPGVLEMPVMPEDGRPWKAITLPLRKDCAT